MAEDIAIQCIARHRYCNKYIGRSQKHQYNNNIIVRIPGCYAVTHWQGLGSRTRARPDVCGFQPRPAFSSSTDFSSRIIANSLPKPLRSLFLESTLFAVTSIKDKSPRSLHCFIAPKAKIGSEKYDTSMDSRSLSHVAVVFCAKLFPGLVHDRVRATRHH
jgi:hypothetical protein